MESVSHGQISREVRTGRVAKSGGGRLYRARGLASLLVNRDLECGAWSGRLITGAPVQVPPPRPVDSLEMRWIVPGALGPPVREWFARFPARTEAREDLYLVWPRLDGLSVKLRNGQTLDVKSYSGSPGILGLPVRGPGRLEWWWKWSFVNDVADPAAAMPPGWIRVRKARRSIWFPLPAAQDPVPGASPAGTGCRAELTEADADGRLMWTVGLEATGSAELLLDAVQHAVGLLFASPLPPEAGFSLDNSWSYAQWLYRALS